MLRVVSYTYKTSLSNDLPATLYTLQAIGIIDMEFSSLFARTAADIKRELDKRGMPCSPFAVGYKELMAKLPELRKMQKLLEQNSYGFQGHIRLLYSTTTKIDLSLIHVNDLPKGIIGNRCGGTDVTLGTGQLYLAEIFRATKKAGVAHFYFRKDKSPIYYQQE